MSGIAPYYYGRVQDIMIYKFKEASSSGAVCVPAGVDLGRCFVLISVEGVG